MMSNTGWMRAIDEALVTTHLGTAEAADSYDTAKRKLGELIDWHVAVALDERVNGGKVLVPAEAVRFAAKVLRSEAGPMTCEAAADGLEGLIGD